MVSSASSNDAFFARYSFIDFLYDLRPYRRSAIHSPTWITGYASAISAQYHWPVKTTMTTPVAANSSEPSSRSRSRCPFSGSCGTSIRRGPDWARMRGGRL